jgi:hypothetical protein
MQQQITSDDGIMGLIIRKEWKAMAKQAVTPLSTSSRDTTDGSPCNYRASWCRSQQNRQTIDDTASYIDKDRMTVIQTDLDCIE